MAGRTVKAVSDMDLDEVSLVDRPANPHSTIVIAKSAQGADMPEPLESETGYFYEDGTPVGADDELGADDIVLDGEGNAFRLSDEAIAEIEDAANENELEVAKSAFGRSGPRGGVSKSLAEELSEQLKTMVSKGADDGTRALLSKAVQAIAASEAATSRAEEIAKSERDIRLTREYIGKAASYGEIPGVTAEELGPVLKLAEENLPHEACVILNKAFEATGGLLFQELGMTGTGTDFGQDPMAVADAAIEAGSIAKSADGKTAVSKAEQRVAFFEATPDAYDQYMAARYGA